MKIFNPFLNITEEITGEVLTYLQNHGRIHRREHGGNVLALRLVYSDEGNPFIQVAQQYTEKGRGDNRIKSCELS